MTKQLELFPEQEASPTSPVRLISVHPDGKITQTVPVRAKRAYEMEMDKEASMRRAFDKAVDFEITGDPCFLPSCKEEKQLIEDFLRSDHYDRDTEHLSQKFPEAYYKVEEKYCPDLLYQPV